MIMDWKIIMVWNARIIDKENLPFSYIGRANWHLPLAGLANYPLLWIFVYLFVFCCCFRPFIIKPFRVNNHDLLCILFSSIKNVSNIGQASSGFQSHFIILSDLLVLSSREWTFDVNFFISQISLFSVCTWIRHIKRYVLWNSWPYDSCSVNPIINFLSKTKANVPTRREFSIWPAGKKGCNFITILSSVLHYTTQTSAENRRKWKWSNSVEMVIWTCSDAYIYEEQCKIVQK